jgi:hypothetical protein
LYKLLKYITLPVGFLILLLRVGAKLLSYAINNRGKHSTV